MITSMSLAGILAMFGAMAALAAVPDASAVAVVARSLASGFGRALVTVLGIIAGDILFILIAVYSLSAIAGSVAGLFTAVQYLGAGYLLWFGLSLWRTGAGGAEIEARLEPSWLSNFLCGLLITLGDPKAILFYLSFLPAFVDLSRATPVDAGILIAVAALAVGGIKGAYALAADRARRLLRDPRLRAGMNRFAGSVMIGTGVYLLARA